MSVPARIDRASIARFGVGELLAALEHGAEFGVHVHLSLNVVEVLGLELGELVDELAGPAQSSRDRLERRQID